MFVERLPAALPQGERSRPEAIPDDATAQRLLDLSALRIALTGESVVDGVELWFKNRAMADEFLRLQGFDTDHPLDVGRLHELHQEAIAYLTEVQGYRLPPEIEEPSEIHELFVLASFGPKRLRRAACMALKVMHILLHITGRELAFNMPVSEAQLLDRLNGKVFALVDRMRAGGLGIKEFAAGKKTRPSLVTKLLAKRDTLATHIFDRLRYRLILETRDDLVRAIQYTVHHLFPFNYVVPEQSVNGIIECGDLARVLDLPLEVVEQHWRGAASVTETPPAAPQNEFSGKTYRCVNLIADIPLRIDDLAPDEAPAIAFVQAEIQLVDQETERSNSVGENSHASYKERQRVRVRKRLESTGRGEEANGGES